jgi:hypothetical protein
MKEHISSNSDDYFFAYHFIVAPTHEKMFFSIFATAHAN